MNRYKRPLRLPLVVTCLCLLTVATAGAVHTVQVGVLAFDGNQQALSRWQPLAEYLDAGIPEHHFRIVPLTHEGFRNRIRKGKLDFILTNPAHYVRCEVNFGASRIATFRNAYHDSALTRFGSVIFTRSDSPVRRLEDLVGRRFAAVNEEAFGGFLLARKRLRDSGIDARQLRLLWLGFPQSEIVQAVVDGRADAGTVRTGVLERMIRDGKLKAAQIRVLGGREVKGFPLLLSTALHPEWPFARLPHTEEELARQVTLRLLQMPPDSPVAQVAGGAGWTIPLDYSVVHDTLRELQVEPYLPRPPSLDGLWRSYAATIVALCVGLGLMVLAGIYILRINRRLRLSQQSLSRHRDQLEQLVEKRTLALIEANDELRRDIGFRVRYEEMLRAGCECLQGIHALVVRDDLSREQRLQSILDLLRQYFGAGQVLLSRVEDATPHHCTASPPLPAAQAPLQPLLAQQAIRSRSQVEDDSAGQDGQPRHYLAAPVVRQGQVVCLIEFLSVAGRVDSNGPSGSDELGMRILQMVAHWLAHENDALARDMQRERALRHLSGLTPREREVLVEVARGAPNKLIARHLDISIKTVELHRSNLMHKLRINNAVELAWLVMQAGIMQTGDCILLGESMG